MKVTLKFPRWVEEYQALHASRYLQSIIKSGMSRKIGIFFPGNDLENIVVTPAPSENMADVDSGLQDWLQKTDSETPTYKEPTLVPESKWRNADDGC